jgi:hypothetical protein
VDDSFDLLVGPPDGDPVPCALESIDADIVRVRLKGGALEPTAEAEVWLSEGPGGASVIVPVVTGWTEDGVCDLFLAEPVELLDEGRVGRDRRRSARVVPAPGEVEVSVQSDRPGVHLPVPIALVDLSAGGMCVEMAVGQEPTLPFVAGVFQILLPGDPFPLMVGARVRHRSRLNRDVVRYGLEFDRRRTSSCEGQLARIAAWVGQRRARVASRVLQGR